ncbi:hypothetical protein BD560DRAFT_332598, partial [Blakeslea trispora]
SLDYPLSHQVLYELDYFQHSKDSVLPPPSSSFLGQRLLAWFPFRPPSANDVVISSPSTYLFLFLTFYPKRGSFFHFNLSQANSS